MGPQEARGLPAAALHPLGSACSHSQAGLDGSTWHTSEIGTGCCALPVSTVVITTKEIPEPVLWSEEGAAPGPELGEQRRLPAWANDYNLRHFKKCRVSCKLFEKRQSSRSLLALLLKAF